MTHAIQTLMKEELRLGQLRSMVDGDKIVPDSDRLETVTQITSDINECIMAVKVLKEYWLKGIAEHVK